MRKVPISVILFLILSHFAVFLTVEICEARNTLYVGGIETGNYSSIQSAIDESLEEDIIFVFSGIYCENVVLNKTINLIGEDKNSTIIDGNKNRYYTILIQARGVNISGFTVQNSSIGICVVGNESISYNNNTITGNKIVNNFGGIYFSNFSNSNIISGNIITENKGDGIRLYRSFNNMIIGNIISDHDGYGLALWDLSNYNVISQNTIFNNRKGIGIRRWSDSNIISDNNIADNRHGIYLEDSLNNNFSNNEIMNNVFGISFEDASKNIISANYIIGNHRGIYLYDSPNNTINSDNIFSNNDIDIWEGSQTPKTPGFELIIVIFAIFLAYLLRRK